LCPGETTDCKHDSLSDGVGSIGGIEAEEGERCEKLDTKNECGIIVNKPPTTKMASQMQAVWIASLNINGATTASKLDMLTDFKDRQGISIILLQEVTHNDVARIRGYDTYLNIGATLRGTALAVRKTTRIQQVQLLPSGRAIAVTYGDLRIVNIYAPSGTSNRVEREHFYNSELPSMMRHTPGTLLLGGDFNCTQTAAETTGQQCPSRALSELIH
jgi:exonuclease III